MPRTFDVIVAGVGAMGSAALYHLAKRGLRVLGIERFGIPNDKGSSHGETRIIRLAYFQGAGYVELAKRARALWLELEEAAAERLFVACGSLDVGAPGSRVFEGSRRSCVQYGLRHDILSSRDLSQNHPAIRPPPDAMGLFQPDGGILFSERCIASHAALARRLGAQIRSPEQLVGWKASANGICVRTDRAVYHAAQLVLTTGAWIARQLARLASLITPERQVMVWLRPLRPALFGPERLPALNMMIGESHYYACPIVGIEGFKLGLSHHLREKVDADGVSRQCTALDESVVRNAAMQYFPDGCGATLALRACLYSNSPDEHFIIDSHPEWPTVHFAAGFSGHGFKFASLVGEAIADSVVRGRMRPDMDMFSIRRFASARKEVRGDGDTSRSLQ